MKKLKKIFFFVFQGTLSTKRVVRMCRQFNGYPGSGGGIKRVFFSAGKQHDGLEQEKDHGQDPGKHIEGINQYSATFPTCDDKGVFTMMMTHTGNGSSLQCQKVGRRKVTKSVVVIWTSSVPLVCSV
jgi:hypothetical protein